MPSVTKLECENVSFCYDRQILFDVSFRASAGEILAIIGPNGSGKTTLLKILYGALRPASGRVMFDGGCSLQSLKRRDIARTVAVVAQEPAPNFPVTVFEFVMHGRYPHLRGFGFEREEDADIVASALKKTGMLELALRRIQETSGGERQRMLLARAIAQEPRILLLDEPTANLDINYQLEILTLVNNLTREKNLCTILVTHDINLISEFADRVLLLSDGRVFQSGTPREVLTEENFKTVFNIDVIVDENPSSGNPRISHRMSVPATKTQGGRL